MENTLDPKAFQDKFFSQLQHLNYLHMLFENIPNLYFWMKNTKGQFVMANRGIVEKCNRKREEDVIGKTDYDFFPTKLCDHYREDDLLVVEKKEKIINRIELVSNENGTINWYSTNKIPLFDADYNVIGVAGITRDLDKTESFGKTYTDMSNVIDYISKHYEEVIEIQTLAQLAGLSVSQFERKFKECFSESPIKFIIKVRITAACKQLIHTDKTISHIAYSTGFYDQSYFSKRFSAHMGMTPKEYRKRYFKGVTV